MLGKEIAVRASPLLEAQKINKKGMIKIEVNGELLFELKSKQDWVNRVPRILPDKTRGTEQWVWVDKNGNIFECGSDFMAAEKSETYPCKVYRLQNVAGVVYPAR